MSKKQSNSDDEVDIDKYRKEYESDDHWWLRKSFLIHHWENFNEDMLLRNAQLFLNIEILGCKYSSEIMQEIAELANQVREVREYRESRQNSLKRSLVGAASVIQAKYKKTELPKPEAIKEEVKMEIDTKNVTDWSSMEKAFWNMESRVMDNDFHLIRLNEHQRLENRRSLLKDVVVFDDINGVFDINKTSVCMSKVGKFESNYDDKTGIFIYIFNGQVLSEGKGESKKQAKKAADKTFEIILRGYCYTIRPKLAFFSPEDVVQRNNGNKSTESTDKLKEDNLGFRMLKSLGWKGGTSLGTKNEGIIDPINLSIKIGRKGLGNDNPSFDAKYFENLLKNFNQNQVEYDLVFSPDFTKEERAQIHQIAQRNNLRTKSYGKNESRHLVISTKISPQVLRQKLIEGNSFFCEKYEIFKPLIERTKKKLL